MKSQIATFIILALFAQFSASAIVKRSVHDVILFKKGTEYVYNYHTVVMTGTHDYESFASGYNVTGQLRIQSTSENTITVKLEDIKFGLYNGKYDFMHQPSLNLKAYEQLNPIEKEFQVTISHGKVTGFSVNKDIPVWAQNIQRGIASALQVDIEHVNQEDKSFTTEEETIWGDCKTNYIVTEEEGHVQIRKHQSHADCMNYPKQVRKPDSVTYVCKDSHTRDVLNSTAYGVFDIEKQDSIWVPKTIIHGSSVFFSLFGTDKMEQYSWAHTELHLKNVNTNFEKLSVSSPVSFNDVKYVFEHQMSADEDLKTPTPFFFHFNKVELDEESMTKVSEQLQQEITKLAESLQKTEVFTDIKKFHKISPFAVLPLVSSLDYEHLKKMYETYKSQDEMKSERQIFTDSLVIAGTGPASLLIRDIVKETDNTGLIARILAPLPNYIRNPTENLVKEFEVLVKKDNVPKDDIKAKINARLIDLAFGSLVYRACKVSHCKQSGLLNKYVAFYSQKYDSADSIEEKTAAVNVLRNIGLEGAIEKITEIAVNKDEERTVRVMAISAVVPFTAQPYVLRKKILPIFFDRKENCEVRNIAGLIYMTKEGDKNVVQEMVMSMWHERSPLVKNFLKSYLETVAHTIRPCDAIKSANARAALQFYPPHQIENKYSIVKSSEYYDKEYNFGQIQNVVVQRSGESALPTAIYMQYNGVIGGYANNYITFFVRLEGLGKTIINKVLEMTTGSIDFEDIKSVMNKVGIKDRTPTPLKIEFAVKLHNKMVTYHYIDESNIEKLPVLLQKLSALKSGYDLELSRMLLMGGVLHESTNHFGTPVSMLSGVTGLAGLSIKAAGGKQGTSISRESQFRFQFHLFGFASLNNHLPPFETMHTVSAHRTLRYRLPRHFTIALDIKNKALNFGMNVPTEEDPLVGMVHGTTFTGVQADCVNREKDAKVKELLKESCSDCTYKTIVSRGEDQRKERQIGLVGKYEILEGTTGGAKYIDCERTHSKMYVFQQLKKFFGPDNKYVGPLGDSPIYRFLLGIQSMRDHLFLLPRTETCGMKVYYHRDTSKPSVFDKVEAQLKLKYTPEPNNKMGTKIVLKSAISFIFTGSNPKTKTVDINALLQTTGMEKREFKLKAICHDQHEPSVNYVACVDINAEAPKAADFFAYEGENEPTYLRTTNILWGKVEGVKEGKEPGCPAGVAAIKMVRKSRRSPAQIEDSHKDMWPYKQCREDKESGKFPGPITPATQACIWSAFKQTNLRESNITIDYRVPKDARNRWRRPIAIATSLLMPYWVAEEHEHAHIQPVQEGNFVEGQVKIDVTADTKRPVMDIHWMGSEGQDEHYHQVDMSWLPGAFGKGRPVYSRFAPFTKTVFDLGFYGYCDVTPKAVQTYNNNTYHADMSECDTVISADCVEEPKYIVLARKISADQIAIKVHLGESKIELENLKTAIVDGKSVPLSEEIYSPSEDKLFKIFKYDDNNVFILSTKLGVYIRYTGYYTTVTLGSRYRTTQCGLCGTFDNIKSNDFTGPDPTCTKLTPTQLMKAYIVKINECASIANPCPK